MTSLPLWECRYIQIRITDDVDAVIAEMCSRGWEPWGLRQLDTAIEVHFKRPTGKTVSERGDEAYPFFHAAPKPAQSA